MSIREFVGKLFYSQWLVSLPYPQTDDFHGKTIIVTGSNTGLGKEAVRHIVRLGAEKVIIACRTTSKGEEAKQDILSTEKGSKTIIEVWELDLGSYDSVKAFAKRASEQLERIDALLENAGVSTMEFRTFEGEESTIVTNVNSTFLLAFLMLPKLKETASKYKTKPILTIVASDVHYIPGLLSERKHPGSIFDNLSNKEVANMRLRYPTSKLLEVLIVRHLVQNYASSSAYPVTINMLTPGFCYSNLSREVGETIGVTIMRWVFWARSTEVGSRTLVHAAHADANSHGQFLMDTKVTETSSWTRSKDGKETEEKVWKELSAKLEKISPGIMSNI